MVKAHCLWDVALKMNQGYIAQLIEATLLSTMATLLSTMATLVAGKVIANEPAERRREAGEAVAS